MTLVEREVELAALGRLHEECAKGRAQAVVISGGVASGKTELLHAFAEQVVQRGAVLLSATGSRAERDVAFGVLGQLAHGTALPGPAARRLLDLLRAAGEDDTAPDPSTGDPSTGDPSTIGAANARLLDEVCTALLAPAAERTVVLLVDDVQFVDDASLQALLYLQRRMRFTRTLVVLTEWAVPRPSRAAFHAELTRQPNTTRLVLDPLSREGVAELLATHLDPRTAAALAPVHHAISGGNPLLVTALVEDHRAAVRAGRPLDGVTAGREFGQGVLACLHRWGPPVLQVARALAVLGEGRGPALLGKLLDTTADAAAQVVEVLEQAGLLDGGRFRHPVARCAVLASLAPAERAGLHLKAAGLLHLDGAGPAELAGHLTEADALGGGTVDRWGADVLRRAAQDDLAAGRLDQAVRRLELALRSTTDDAERADVTTLLLRVEWVRNPSAAAAHLAPLLAARDRGALSRRNLLHLSEFLFWYGHIDQLTATLADVAPAPAGTGAEEADHAGARVGSLSFLHPTALPAQAGPGGAGRDLPTTVGLRPADLAATAERVLQSGRVGGYTFGTQAAALAALVYFDHVDRAGQWFETLLADSDLADTRAAVVGALRAEALFRQGDLAEAGRQARAAYEALAPQSWGIAIVIPLAVGIAAHTAMGRHDEAAALLRTPVPEAVFRTQLGLLYLYARGQHLLATDRALAALADFDRCRELAEVWHVDLPAPVPWRVGAAQAHLALDDREAAHALARQQLEHPALGGDRGRGVALRVLAATVPAQRQVPILRESVELLQAGGDKFELARALLELSNAHNAVGECETARTVARRAAQMAKGCQAEPLTLRLRPVRDLDPAEQWDERVEHAGMASLSEAERRVAVLAALGHTNREIGVKLYISVSTVEQHLTKVYRKLNVTRRTELPVRLPRRLVAGQK
ncbi:helix-turn-helix transcriptional regulator [Saccharothrix longispora]|uniref:helix-turn-helix transcriptional regulator n=1 Tax=Saccharothrix longispora TaxID=33920 RepID=UPI0028FD467E|nr:AAA family ATPase [Saccharothrix longispora]MDU0288257.1 AAA family ATPase [Saccharothrix longispora]